MEHTKKEPNLLTQSIISIGAVALLSGTIMWSTYIPEYKQSGFYECLYSYEWDNKDRMRDAPSDFDPYPSVSKWKNLSCGYKSSPLTPPIINIIGVVMIIIGLTMIYIKPSKS